MKMRTLNLAIMLLGATGIASASQGEDHRGIGEFHQDFGFNEPFGDHGRFQGSSAPMFEAPEIDPNSMIAGLTLLSGALIVLRGRRATKAKD